MAPDQPAIFGEVVELNLPPAVRAALDDPASGERLTVDAAGIPWSALAWGEPSGRPVLLLHGASSSARSWWRLPDQWLPRFEAVIGPGRIHTMRGGPHSPHRSHPVEVTSAILAALS